MTTYDEPVVADLHAPVRPGPPWHQLARWYFALAWAVVVGLVWLTLTRWLDLDEPGRLVALAQGITPFVYFPVWVIGATALLGRRWLLAGACAVLAVVHVISILPAMGSDDVPPWAREAPALTVLTTNTYVNNTQPEAAANQILAVDADVVVLIEANRALVRALDELGMSEEYPFSTPGRRAISIRIFSRLPLSDVSTVWVPDNGFPTATISVGSRSLRLAGVHTSSALHGSDDWRQQLDELERYAAGADEPLVLTGDFNGNRWHPPFKALLDEGLTDAHEARGKGLSRSWPAGLLPLMRLDHVLVSDDVAVLDVRDVEIPGSDHLASLATLSVRPSG